MFRRLRLTIDGQTCHAVLAKGPLAEQLTALCPFTAEFQRRGGQLEEDAADLLETAGGVISVRCDLETE